MGKVILVPPTVEFDKVVPAYGGRFTGGRQTYPATVTSLHPMSEGDTYITKNELSSTLAMAVSVSIPDPSTDLYREDPLQRYLNFYHLGKLQLSKREKEYGSWLGWDMRADLIPHTFWDHREVEELAAQLRGDLLLQVGEQQWKFHATDPDDASVIPQLLFRPKKHKFTVRRTSPELKNELHDWLMQHTTEFDFDPNMNPTIYIRNETEATHFKLKWVGDNIHGPFG